MNTEDVVIYSGFLTSLIGAFFISWIVFKKLLKSRKLWVKTLVSVIIFNISFAVLIVIIGIIIIFSMGDQFTR